MTPKEKAKELVELMEWEGEDKGEQCYQDFAKQCALIAVDEILKYQDSLVGMLDTDDGTDAMFWINVKQEIEAL